MQEEKLIDIKGTLEQFIKTDEPEMTQEEAIMKYEEKSSKKKNSNDDETDVTEEQEHLKRVKQELLASLERVKKLEKQIYGQKENDEKSKLKVDKPSGGRSGGRTTRSEQDRKTKIVEENITPKERE